MCTHDRGALKTDYLDEGADAAPTREGHDGTAIIILILSEPGSRQLPNKIFVKQFNTTVKFD